MSLFCLEFYFTFYPFYCILSLNDASPGHPILPAHSCLLVHCCKPLLFSYLYPLQWVLTAYPTNPKALPWLSSPSTDQVVPNFYAPRSSLPSPYTVKNYTYHSWMNLVNYALVMLLPSCGQKASPLFPLGEMFFPSKGNPDVNLRWIFPFSTCQNFYSYIHIQTKDTHVLKLKFLMVFDFMLQLFLPPPYLL